MASNNYIDFEQHIANLPHSAAVLATDVIVLAESGEELQAESILRLALGKHGASELRVALANVLIRQNRHKEAMTEMVGVLRADPENSDALLVLATCLMECGELDRGGKMLQKARLAGVDTRQGHDLEKRWHELVAQSTNPAFAALTLPDIGPQTTPPPGSAEEQRKRNETLMGRPTSGRAGTPPNFDVGDPTGHTAPPRLPADAETSKKPRRLPPPPLQSGTFASLDTWDIDDADENDLDTTAIAPEKLRLSDEGPLERIPIPAHAADSSGDYAKPTDMTSALVLDDDLAAPDEHTGHIPYSEVERGLRNVASPPTVERDIESMPSVEYDANFAAEARDHQEPTHAPPADLDDLPAYDSDIQAFQAESPTAEDHWNEFDPHAQAMPAQNFDERPPVDYGDWNDIPSMPPAKGSHAPSHTPADTPNPFQSAPSFGGPPQPAAVPHHRHTAPPSMNEMSWELQRNDVPQMAPHPGAPGPRRREETAIAASPVAPPPNRDASSSLRFLVERRWPLVLVITLALISSGFVAITLASGWSLASSMKSGMQAASTARTDDTFVGFQTAEQKLLEVTATHSFMGSGFDRFVEKTLPIPGLSGANLRRRAIAELAAVSAILEYRFEKAGSRAAPERLVIARDVAATEPATAIAEAYVALVAHEPMRAIEVLEAARAQHPGDVNLAETHGWALLDLDRPADASKTVEDLRAVPAPTVHQKFLLASIDAARGDSAAAKSFADLFADSPDHADARIGRAHVLLKSADEKAHADAQKALDAVLTTLAESTSNFQRAQATSAYGKLHLTAGKKDAAEERLRSAVSKMPTRGELYLPLLKFLESTEKRDEIDALLQRARSQGAYTHRLAFYEAELRLMQSKPEQTLKILDVLEFEDARKAFLNGLALIDQYKPKPARDVLEKGQNAPGDPLHAQALFYVARSLVSEDALEDALYQLDRLKSKNADNAVVHWAAATVGAAAAEITTSKSTRTERLSGAVKDIERAYELDPSWPPNHFTRCDVLLRELQTERAEEFCFSGRALAPQYAPGLVTTARLRLMEGKFDDAHQLSQQALQLRPNDPVVGLLAARVAIERRELDEAKKLINRWLGKSVDQYELSVLEGRREFARENYTRAAGYLKEAFELRPNAGEASIYYGHTLARLGDFNNAGTLLRKYLNHPTWSGYAWAVLGEVRRKQRRFKDAYENLNKALDIYAKQSVPARYWSHAYTEYALTNQAKFRKWSHPQVKRMLDRGASKGDPDDPGLNMSYGQYYLNLRRPDYGAAMKHIQKVVDVAPHRCDAVEALQRLYERAERDAEQMAALAEIHTENCAPPEEKK